jgi:tetratricopeptide (TPR) repeat protein
MNDMQNKKAEELTTKGFASLREGEYEVALEAAKELEEMRHTAAFDIAAQAYAGMDDLENAVKTLNRGLEKAPKCWLNWQLLGNYLSDMENYDNAAAAYENALACPDVWVDSIHLNQAVLATRRCDYESALVILNEHHDDELRLVAASSRMEALEGIGRLDEAVMLAEELLAGEYEEESDGKYFGLIAAALARIRLRQGSAPNEVRNFVLEAVRLHGSNSALLRIIRNIDAQYSKEAHYFRLLIDCQIPEDNPLYSEVKGYYVTYDVVSDSASHALDIVRDFESDIGAKGLHVEESEILEPRPDDPCGVYKQFGRCYYADEED